MYGRILEGCQNYSYYSEGKDFPFHEDEDDFVGLFQSSSSDLILPNRMENRSV